MKNKIVIEWRPIPDFPGYEVSNTGLVRSHRRGSPRILRTGNHPVGYRQVGLRRNGKTHVFKVGHLVLFAFQGSCPEGLEMCHNDGNPTNDHFDNLRWDTHEANMQDFSEHRLAEIAPGEIRNEAFASAVRDIHKEWGMTYGEFAEYIGVGQSSLYKLYTKGIGDNIIVKILRRFPFLAYLFVSDDYDVRMDPHFRPRREQHDEEKDDKPEVSPISGKQIEIMRIVRGISQEEFAELVGVTYQTVSCWQNDHNIPRDENLEKIKAALAWPSDDQAEVAFGILAGDGG